MASQHLPLQECGTLNRVFAAFFMNECYVKEGINFEESKPIDPRILSLNDGYFFNEKDSPYGLKSFFHGKVVIEDIKLETFMSVGIYDFFNDEMKNKISDVVKDFAYAVHQNRHCDFVFSNLSDVQPFIFDCILDPDTNFKSRLVIVHDIATNQYTAIWEFYCLLMIRLREGEEHPIYGKSYIDVDQLSPQKGERSE